MILTQLQAEAVWASLVAMCGASDDVDERDQFVYHAQRDSMSPLEYRFQGDLGFGGKVYLENPPRVSCYQKDETPERRRKIDHANQFFEALAKLWEQSVTAGK